MIRLRMLGSIDLRDHGGGEVLPVLTQPRRLALLAYLSANAAHGFQRRDRLLAVFWPEMDDERARGALNRAVYHLRRSLGADSIVSRGAEELGVSAALWTDVAAFHDAVREGRAPDALELYRGDLLDGFFISDAPDFEHWLDEERARMRADACRVARDFARMEDAAGRTSSAVHWTRWALAQAPYDEGLLQELIGLLHRSGDRAGVLLAHEQFVRRLADDLGLAPSPATAALIEQARAAGDAPAGAEEAPADVGPEAHSQTATPPEILLSQGSVRVGSRARPWRAPVLVGVAASLGLATLLLTRGPAEVGGLAQTTAEPDRHRVLVTPLENRTGDPALERLGQLAADLIAQELPREGVRYVGGPLAGPDPDPGNQPYGLEVSGAYYRVGSELRFEVHVVDVQQNRLVWAIPTVAGPGDAPQLGIERVRDRVAGAVGALLDARFATWLPLATSPPNVEAFRAFARGMELQGSGQAEQSLPYYELAYRSDETFTQALIQLADAHQNAIQTRQADSIYDLVSQHRGRMTPLQLHWLDWLLAVRRGDLMAAYLAAERAAQIAPQRFLHLQIEAARWLNRPRKMVELMRPAGADPARPGAVSWFQLADAYHQLRDTVNERIAADRGRRARPGRPEALYPSIRYLASRGRVDEVNAWLDSALSYPAGNRIDVGPMMTMAAQELRAHGYGDAASPVLERAIAWYRSIPADPLSGVWPRVELARALANAGRLDEAEAVARTVESEDPDLIGIRLGLLGTIEARRHDRAQAEAHFERLEALRPSLSRPDEIAGYWQARIRALLGDDDDALRILRQSVGPQGTDLHAATELESLASDPAFLEFIRPKG